MDNMAGDLAHELDFWLAVELLNKLEQIIFHSGRLGPELAQIEEFYPTMPWYQRQLLAKKRVIEQHPDGGSEMAEWFYAAAQRRDAGP